MAGNNANDASRTAKSLCGHDQRDRLPRRRSSRYASQTNAHKATASHTQFSALFNVEEVTLMLLGYKEKDGSACAVVTRGVPHFM